MSTPIIVIATLIACALVFTAGRASRRAALTQLADRLGEMTWRAGHDPLTGLPNRYLAEQVFNDYRNPQLLVVLIDLDGFKNVNDCYGHDVGDHLLTAIAERLARAADRHRGTAARLAGDEFVLLLPDWRGDYTEPVAAILGDLAAVIVINTADTSDLALNIHASAGITFATSRTESWAAVLRRADLALYHAKSHTTGAAIYTPGMGMPGHSRRYGPRLRDQHTPLSGPEKAGHRRNTP